MAAYRSRAEFQEKVRYYIAHPERADEIRNRGFARIRRQWTYRHWVEWAFREMEIA